MAPPSKPQEIEWVDPTDRALSVGERRELSLDVFKQLEEELFNESAQVIHGALAFADVSEEDMREFRETQKLPEGWRERYGLNGARKRMRLAMAAWLPASEAPVGLKLAQATYIGIARVRAGDKLIAHQLNIGIIQIPESARPLFPEKEVEK